MSLTELSFYIRRYAPFAVLGLLVAAIIVTAVQLILTIRARQGQQARVYNIIFNSLPNPLANLSNRTEGMSFSLDTIDGRAITATDSAHIFFLQNPNAPRFGYEKKVNLVARGVGIDIESAIYRVIGRSAIFSQPNQNLRVDIQNFNFTYEYKFENEPELFAGTIKPTDTQAQSQARTFLQSIDSYPKDLQQGETSVIYFHFDPTTKKVETIQTSANAKDSEGPTPNIAEVDFARPDIDGIPVVSKTFYNSHNYVLMTFFEDGSNMVLKAQLEYFDRSLEQVGTYPLRTGDEAYNDLISGEGYIIANPLNEQVVTIKKMFLAYFDNDEYQEYLQPVYVFLGEDSNFVAYVPAVDKRYMTDQAQSSGQ